MSGFAHRGVLSDSPATSGTDWPDPILPVLRRYREIWGGLSAISDAEDAIMMAERNPSRVVTDEFEARRGVLAEELRMAEKALAEVVPTTLAGCIAALDVVAEEGDVLGPLTWPARVIENVVEGLRSLRV